MRAWIVAGTGEPENVLRLGGAPSPQPDGEAVIVAVEAAGLNFLDAMMCRGTYPAQLAPPIVPGAELVGRVVDPGASGFSVGDRVAAISPLGAGCLAEQAAVPPYAVLPLPDDVPAADGAALLVTYQTAWFALHHRAALRAGEVLLVHAGAGGVGAAAIQLGKAAGATVIATARGAAKLDVCRQEGADLAFDYEQEDLVARVLDFTHGRGADVICDQVGGACFEQSLRCLAFEGRILPIGWASGVMPTVDLSALVQRNQTLIGLSWGSTYSRLRHDLVRDAHERLLALYREGRIRPRISAIAPFEEAAQALQRLATGRTIGKTIVLAARP